MTILKIIELNPFEIMVVVMEVEESFFESPLATIRNFSSPGINPDELQKVVSDLENLIEELGDKEQGELSELINLILSLERDTSLSLEEALEVWENFLKENGPGEDLQDSIKTEQPLEEKSGENELIVAAKNLLDAKVLKDSDHSLEAKILNNKIQNSTSVEELEQLKYYLQFYPTFFPRELKTLTQKRIEELSNSKS